MLAVDDTEVLAGIPLELLATGTRQGSGGSGLVHKLDLCAVFATLEVFGHPDVVGGAGAGDLGCPGVHNFSDRIDDLCAVDLALFILPFHVLGANAVGGRSPLDGEVDDRAVVHAPFRNQSRPRQLIFPEAHPFETRAFRGQFYADFALVGIDGGFGAVGHTSPGVGIQVVVGVTHAEALRILVVYRPEWALAGIDEPIPIQRIDAEASLGLVSRREREQYLLTVKHAGALLPKVAGLAKTTSTVGKG